MSEVSSEDWNRGQLQSNLSARQDSVRALWMEPSRENSKQTQGIWTNVGCTIVKRMQ